MVLLTFHVGASTYFNTSECSHASLHRSNAGSCKQSLIYSYFKEGCPPKTLNSKRARAAG